MLYTIKNEALKVVIDNHGAELHSIQTLDGTEYLWQGDPAVWNGQAPNLFPYVARLTDQKYTFEGKEYSMKIHGFINAVDLYVETEERDQITFRYDSGEETLTQYPFPFIYRITYLLDGHTLKITNKVENIGEKRMYFGLGGHPGFNVPLEAGLSFEDYCLEFSEKANPSRVLFTDDCYRTGENVDYPLADGVRIPLHHDLFDRDAIVLKNVDHRVTIRSDKGKRAVSLFFPDFPAIGFWHMPKMEAPYVCLEPWRSLPSRKGIVEDFAQQEDLVALDGGKIYVNKWSVDILE